MYKWGVYEGFLTFHFNTAKFKYWSLNFILHKSIQEQSVFFFPWIILWGSSCECLMKSLSGTIFTNTRTCTRSNRPSADTDSCCTQSLGLLLLLFSPAPDFSPPTLIFGSTFTNGLGYPALNAHNNTRTCLYSNDPQRSGCDCSFSYPFHFTGLYCFTLRLHLSRTFPLPLLPPASLSFDLPLEINPVAMAKLVLLFAFFVLAGIAAATTRPPNEASSRCAGEGLLWSLPRRLRDLRLHLHCRWVYQDLPFPVRFLFIEM